MNFPDDPMEKLKSIMSLLRSPNGCPWDQLQTPDTLRPYLLEEAYEVYSAVSSKELTEIRDELGDLLLQIVFLADIYKEMNAFDFNDVAESICEKLIRRHPHVFSDGDETCLEKLDLQWESIKSAEKAPTGFSILENLQTNLPALLLAQKSSTKVSRVGFDWADNREIREQLDSELLEFDEAVANGDKNAISHEIGDILFTIVNLGRHHDIDCETALQEMVKRFRSRFMSMEQMITEDGKNIDQLNIEQLNFYWQRVKAANGKET